MKIALSLIFIFLLKTSFGQNLNLVNVDSNNTKLIENSIVVSMELNGYYLFEDTAFYRTENSLDEYNKNQNWLYDFNTPIQDGKFIFDSDNTQFLRFALRFTTDTTVNSLDFSIDGIVYDSTVYVNKRKYCTQKLGAKMIPSRFLESDYDSILNKLKEIYSFNYKWKNWGKSSLRLYSINIPNFSRKNIYFLSYEILPIYGSYTDYNYKNSANSIVSNQDYVELNKCNCDDYELVLLIRSWYTSPDKLTEKSYSSYSFDYLMVKMNDLRIIEKGSFSFENHMK